MTDDAVELPTDVLAEHIRKQLLLDCDLDVLAPEGVDVDVWDTIRDADVKYVEYVPEDSELHAVFETETHAQKRVARATHWEPAEYENHYLETFVNVVWDFDPEHNPDVEIEVVGTYE